MWCSDIEAADTTHLHILLHRRHHHHLPPATSSITIAEPTTAITSNTVTSRSIHIIIPRSRISRRAILELHLVSGWFRLVRFIRAQDVDSTETDILFVPNSESSSLRGGFTDIDVVD